MADAIKPKLEDFAKITLADNEKLKNVLDFINFLSENGLFTEKVSKHFWAVKHKKVRLCTMRVGTDYWWIRFYGRTDGGDELLDNCGKYMSDELKEFLISRINEAHCKPCNGKSKLFFGKLFERVCWCSPVGIGSPDGKNFEYVKETVLINRATVDNYKSK